MLFRKQLLVIIKKGIIKSTIKMRIDLIVHNEFVAVWEKCVSLEGHLIYWCPFFTLLNVDRRLCTPLRLLSTCGAPDVLYGHIWITQPMSDLKLDHNCFWLVEIHSACQKWLCSEAVFCLAFSHLVQHSIESRCSSEILFTSLVILHLHHVILMLQQDNVKHLHWVRWLNKSPLRSFFKVSTACHNKQLTI